MRKSHLMSLVGSLAAGAAITLAQPAMAQTVDPQADVVVAGSDYLRTLPGTFFNLPGYGTIDLQGNPIGPGLLIRSSSAWIT